MWIVECELYGDRFEKECISHEEAIKFVYDTMNTFGNDLEFKISQVK